MKNIENKLINLLLEENSKEDLIRKILDLNNPTKDDYQIRYIGPAGGIVFMQYPNGFCVECWTQDEPNLMTWDKAHEHVQTLNYGGYNDWILPTIDELNKIYENKNRLDNFQGDFYWSNTEYDAFLAWNQLFSIGNQYSLSKNNRYRVRAVRRFK